MTAKLDATPVRDFLVREEKIERLERLMIALAQAADRNPDQKKSIRAGIAAALSAECPICRAQIDGAHLLMLADLPNAAEKAGIKRLRQGLCAREKCKSSYYRIHLGQHPDLDWPTLFSKKETVTECEVQIPAEPIDPAVVAARRKKKLLRLAIFFGLLLLALWLRQIYFGGTIPLLRQPEKFHVDPLPAGGTSD